MAMSAVAFEDERRDLFNDLDFDERVLARESAEDARQQIGGDGRNDAEDDGSFFFSGHFEHFGLCVFELAEYALGFWQKGAAEDGELCCAQHAVEEGRA